MRHSVYTLKRISMSLLIVGVVIASAFFVSHVCANRGGGYYEDINPDGTGWKTKWLYNWEGTASATAAVSKWTGGSHTSKFEVASVYTSGTQKDSDIGSEGSYLIAIGFEGRQEHESYEGHISRSLSYTCKGWFRSPGGFPATAYAFVRVDHESDTGEVSVEM